MIKIRTIEVNELLETCNKFYSYDYNKYTTIDWCGTPLVIRKMIEPKEIVSLFENVLSLIRNNDIVNTSLFDFAFRLTIVSAYSFIEMPDNVETQYKVLYGTDLFNVIINNINKPQFNSIVTSFNIYFGTDIGYR